MKNSSYKFSKIITILATVVNISFLVFLFKYDILPSNQRLILLLFLSLIVIITIYLAFRKNKKTKTLRVLAVILLIISLFEGIFIAYANKSIKTIEQINQKDEIDKNEMSFVVLKDSSIQSLEEAASKEIAVSNAYDEANTKKALAEYKSKFSYDLIKKDLGVYSESAQALMNGDSEVMLLNENYRPLIEEEIEDFSKKTRVLESVVVSDDEKDQREKEEVNESDSFNVYISGIDTYGSISTVSRSDVNLVLSVNPVDRKVLITTVPRDTYLAIGGDNNKLDKLTHAGLFGVDTSIKSLENLLYIDIDYYSKVNFTTLTKLIDVIGGITVDNPVAFKTSNGSYEFPKGKVDMYGAKALAYSRERYNLSEGDFDRGKNQTRVMTAIIKKMLRPESLLNFNEIANIALESVDTDVPYSKMIELVNNQLEDGKDWTIETQALKGEGASGLSSYLMPNAKLYMMVADENSIKEVHNGIEENNKQVKE